MSDRTINGLAIAFCLLLDSLAACLLYWLAQVAGWWVAMGVLLTCGVVALVFTDYVTREES